MSCSHSWLLTRCFPAAAAWNAAGRALPFARSAVAVELATGVSRANRYFHNAIAADVAGDVGAGGRDLAVGDRERVLRCGFTAPGLGHDGHAPKSVVRRLGHGRSGKACRG